MIVVAVVVVSMVVMRRRGVGVVSMALVVMLDLIAARIARMRPEYGYEARENGAQQRQKDDCLNHSCVSPSSD
jgi:hypothetical protein